MAKKIDGTKGNSNERKKRQTSERRSLGSDLKGKLHATVKPGFVAGKRNTVGRFESFPIPSSMTLRPCGRTCANWWEVTRPRFSRGMWESRRHWCRFRGNGGQRKNRATLLVGLLEPDPRPKNRSNWAGRVQAALQVPEWKNSCLPRANIVQPRDYNVGKNTFHKGKDGLIGYLRFFAPVA